MTWMNYSVIFIHGLVVTPFTLKQFGNIEYSFWILLQTLLSFSLLIDSGFGHTLSRTVSFFFGGAKKIPNSLKEFKNLKSEKGEPNYLMLNKLLGTSAKVYTIVALTTILIMGVIGPLILWNLLNMSDHSSELWLSIGLMLALSFISIQGVKWNSFMVGTLQVATQNQIQSAFGVFQLVTFLVILIFFPSIPLLLSVLIIKTLIGNLLRKNLVIKKLNESGDYYTRKKHFDKEIFSPLWRSTWRMGLSQWGSFFSKSGVSIVISQVQNPALMASFLFTNKILEFVQKIAQGPFNANIPAIYSNMAQKNFAEVKRIISGNVFLMSIIFLGGVAGFALFGNKLLDLLSIDKRIVPLGIYLVFCTRMFLYIHSLVHGTTYIATNTVPFYIPSIITGGLTVLGGFLILPHYDLMGVVWVQLIAFLLINAWQSTYLNLKLINWNFFHYCKDIIVIGSVKTLSSAKGFIKK